MRLGVVITGTLERAAAGIGVLCELERRGVEPHAVCGLMGGAWPAALFTAGMDGADMRRAAASMEGARGRLYAPQSFAFRRLRRGASAIAGGRALDQMLISQAGQRMLALCPRTGVFLCRAARTGQCVAFSSRALMQEHGMMLSMQASVSFAARAAMTLPPFLPPMEWMGSPLLPHGDAAQACRVLLALGAQRVLVVRPQLCPACTPGALELTGMAVEQGGFLPQEARVLNVPLPAETGNYARLPACVEAGERAAQHELDAIFSQMGMAFCRVIPFRRYGP